MNRTSRFSDRIKAFENRLTRRVGVPLFIMLASVLPYLIPAMAARAVLPANRELGWALALLSLALAGAVFWQLRLRLRTSGPAIYIVALMSTLLFLGIGSFAAISTAIYIEDPTAYKVIVPRLLIDTSPGIGASSIIDPFGFFADHYLWVFFDMLPGIEVNETLKFVAPAEPMSTAAAIPVLGFRIYVLLALIASYKTWRKKGEKTVSAIPILD
jgi:hypothetical protein